jgi:two-component system sensor histidine kinase MprB
MRFLPDRRVAARRQQLAERPRTRRNDTLRAVLEALIRMPRTLRARLVAAATVSILIAVTLFAVAAAALVWHDLHGTLDGALRHRAQDVARLAVSAPDLLAGPGGLEGPVGGRELSVEVIDARGRILSRSSSLGARLLPQDQLVDRARRSGQPGFENIRLGGHPLRLYAAPIAQAGGPAAGGAVIVASDSSDIAETAGRLAVVLTLAGLGATVLAAIAAAVLTRRGLRPLQRLAGAAQEIERTGDPSRRLPEADVRDEIGELTGVLNRMLAGLERSREGERRFLADASHELRTPVTTLLGNVEYLTRYGANPEIVEELRGDALRLARLVDDLLVLERFGASPAEPGVVELDAVARAAARAAGAAADADGRVVLGELEPVRVPADADALGRAISNLIENGLVHGPDGGLVTVSVSARDGHGLVTVRDEGAGPDPRNRDRLFERLWRGPEAAGRPGSGLGLAITAAIAERSGGRVIVDGAAFTIELPAVRGDGPADEPPESS